ncbi:MULTISPECIES: PaaI family thioesterase [Burkholderia]|uniref:PaaI family thioesterase n=1 Tax=Burkholderia TaxID=32008 RepID=UPI0021AB2377|nr:MULTISPECIES: PaaI family thioesterase [Burkholderia]
MIDAACGFAASTVCDPVLAAQFAVRCLAPAKGQAFIVRGRVVKAGRRQVFASADLHCQGPESSEPQLCATGDAVLALVGGTSASSP